MSPLVFVRVGEVVLISRRVPKSESETRVKSIIMLTESLQAPGNDAPKVLGVRKRSSSRLHYIDYNNQSLS